MVTKTIESGTCSERAFRVRLELQGPLVPEDQPLNLVNIGSKFENNEQMDRLKRGREWL